MSQTPADQDTAAVTLHAIRHTLEQINTNPILGFHAGAFTETYESLVSAYALLTKRDRDEIWKHHLPQSPKKEEIPKDESVSEAREEIERLCSKLEDYENLRDQLEDLVRDLPGRILHRPAHPPGRQRPGRHPPQPPPNPRLQMTQQSKRVRTTTVTRVVLKPIQCCRCKRIHSESDRVYVKRLIYGVPGKQSTCPRCGAHSYYSLRADGKPQRFGEQQAEEITVTERVRR